MLHFTLGFAAASSLRGNVWANTSTDIWATTSSDDQCTAVWGQAATDGAGTFTCGERIEYLMGPNGGSLAENLARDRIAAEFPSICGSCASCDAILSLNANGFTCSQRIQWLMSAAGGSVADSAARARVAAEFSQCNGLNTMPCWRSSGLPTSAPTSAPTTTDDRNSPSPTTDTRTWDRRCAAAVDHSGTCEQQLWQPTGDANGTQPCYRYGGPADPCALNVNNDRSPNPADDYGMDKNPSLCTSTDKVFYLWDEPDTQAGRSYDWAAEKWLQYADRWAGELATMRAGGWKVTTPLFEFSRFAGNVREFFDGCVARGADCYPSDNSINAGTTPSSNRYAVDVIAANMFCGTWNSQSAGGQPTTDECRGGIHWQFQDSQGQFRQMRQNTPATASMPVYITNWARTNGCGALTPTQQLVGMDATDAFWAHSQVKRVYWFGASNYQGHQCPNNPIQTGNFLTDQIRPGETMGDRWRAICTRSTRK